jgi:hypothetical protein
VSDDITEHSTLEEEPYCCCALDTFSPRIVAWQTDCVENSTWVVNALDRAIKTASLAVWSSPTTVARFTFWSSPSGSGKLAHVPLRIGG